MMRGPSPELDRLSEVDKDRVPFTKVPLTLEGEELRVGAVEIMRTVKFRRGPK